MGKALCDYMARLVREDTGRVMMVQAWLDIYEGRANTYPETGYGMLYAESRMGAGGGDRLINATRSIIDTNHSKATAEIPQVRAAGVGADGSQRLRAMRLSRFIAGALDGLKYGDRVGPTMAADALKTGVGIVKTLVVDGRVELENVPATEVFQDRGEARYGCAPRTYQLKAYDRHVARELWGNDDPEAMEAIDSAGSPIEWVCRRLPVGHDYDLIDVYEAWDTQTHRHVVAVENFLIVDEPYEHEEPPLVFLSFLAPAPGRGGPLQGIGMVETLDPLQYEIDELLTDIGTAIRMGSRYKIFADAADQQLNEDALLDPGFGSLVYGKGKAPQFLAPDPVAEVTITHLQWLLQQMYSLGGTSEISASGQKPAGLTSGVSLLNYHSLASQRFVDFIKRLAEATCQVALSLIDRAADIEDGLNSQGDDDDSDDGGSKRTGWSTRYSKGSAVRELKYADVRMERSDFVIKVEDVSPTPDSFSGREQLIAQMNADGTLPPAFLASFVEDPDVVRANMMATADADRSEAIVEALLDPDGEPPTLDDNMNTALATDTVRAALQRGYAQGLDADTLARMSDCIHRLKDLEASLAPPPAPSPPPAGAPGAPMPGAMAGPANPVPNVPLPPAPDAGMAPGS